MCSMGDILLVEEEWLLIDPESLMRSLDRDRFLVVVGIFVFASVGIFCDCLSVLT